MKRDNSQLAPPDVLLVDKSDDFWFIFKRHAERQLPHFTFHRTSDILQALRFLQGWPAHHLPLVILQGLFLPERADGFTLLKTLKQPGSPYAAVPAVVVTASHHPEDKRMAMELGAQDYWLKPMSTQQWMELIGQLQRVIRWGLY